MSLGLPGFDNDDDDIDNDDDRISEDKVGFALKKLVVRPSKAL